jgi:16S rRNA G966 N2-methylase RsmD
MGLEALSRGFKNVVSVEKNISVVRIIKENFKTIGLEPRLYVGDSLKVLTRFITRFVCHLQSCGITSTHLTISFCITFWIHN